MLRCRDPEGNLVFSYRGRVSDPVLAEKVDICYRRGYLFTILPENNVGLSFINECKKYDWFHWMLKERKNDTAKDDNVVQKYGFRTTEKSKDLIVRKYRAAIWSGKIDADAELLKEISSYEYDSRNRPNATSPNHDDVLMADMICVH